jgi:murein DD-endopeptidase MepM/ murein hydrolase activator NlpD
LESAKPNITAPIYRYNAETCRYERTKRSWVSKIFYVLNIAVVACVMLIGLLLLHDYLFDSKNEIKLTLENQSLQKNQKIIGDQLAKVQVKLASLKEKDQLLHKKFFGAEEKLTAKYSEDYSGILFFGIDDYTSTLNRISQKSQSLLKHSQKTSHALGSVLHLNPTSFAMIESLPVTAPLKNFDISSVLSGYGLRIHPFHKGLYNHLGMDIALPRGTEVITPANGVVIIVGHSELLAGYGNYIEIEHGNGITTRYAHLDDIHVRVGQRLTRGTVIGLSGNSGGSIAPHLHYEIIRNGINVDPVNYFAAALNAKMFEHLKNTSSIQNQSLD